MFRKLTRFINNSFFLINSEIRKIKSRLLYSQISIDKKTILEKGCKIICSNGGSISIRNCRIGFNSIIHATKGAKISLADSFIGHNCTIVAKSKIIVKSHCLIAELVTIRDQDHIFSDRTKLIQEQGFTSEPIVIQENVWIGCKVTVLPGSTIGKNCVIGAHSLVKGVIQENSLYAGTPAIKKKSF